MMVVCINSGSFHLTVNKKYEVEDYAVTSVNDYYITNDIGFKHVAESNLFIELIIIREQKLQQLGIL